MLAPRALTFHHTNGWTLSVAPNVGGIGYSVVAFPTAAGGYAEDNAFVWEGGHTECWCSSLSSLVTDAQELLNALPPRPHFLPGDTVSTGHTLVRAVVRAKQPAWEYERGGAWDFESTFSNVVRRDGAKVVLPLVLPNINPLVTNESARRK